MREDSGNDVGNGGNPIIDTTDVATLQRLAETPRWFSGTSGQLTANDEQRAWMELSQDDRFSALAAAPAPYGNAALKNISLDDYAFNDPRSPLYGLSLREQGAHSGGAYRIASDAAGNPIDLQWVQLGPQHWYTDIGIIGPVIVAVAGGTFALIEGGGEAAAGAAAAGASTSTAGAAAGAPSALAAILGAVTPAAGAIIHAITPTNHPQPAAPAPAPFGSTIRSSEWIALALLVGVVLFANRS